MRSLPFATGTLPHVSFRSTNAICSSSAVIALSQREQTVVSQRELNCNITSTPDVLEVVNNLNSVMPRLSGGTAFDLVSPFLLFAFYKAAMIHVDQTSHLVRIRCPESFKVF